MSTKEIDQQSLKTIIDSITFKPTFIRLIDNDKEWMHYLWNVSLNGVDFEFKLGIGHVHKKTKKPLAPTLYAVLNCLIMDANCGSISFDDFCIDYGYNSDSIKDFNTYQECMRTKTKLKSVLKNNYNTLVNNYYLLEE